MYSSSSSNWLSPYLGGEPYTLAAYAECGLFFLKFYAVFSEILCCCGCSSCFRLLLRHLHLLAFPAPFCNLHPYDVHAMERAFDVFIRNIFIVC
jgi:hypothetical protein